jgi:hypothetical protein
VEDGSIEEGYICECKEQCSSTWLLRKILEWIQIVCIVVCVILSMVVYWLRKTKVMNVAMWPITESILFGSILLYTSVILKIEIPTNTAMLCLFEPWTRELGFTLLYGGIILKIYRQAKRDTNLLYVFLLGVFMTLSFLNNRQTHFIHERDTYILKLTLRPTSEKSLADVE